MKKIFISMPISGLSEAEVKRNRQQIIQRLKSLIQEDFQVIDTWITQQPSANVNNEGVWFLGKSLTMLSYANLAVFANEWVNYRGCCIEHKVCEDYEIPIMYLI